jgi:hypothetical protein
MKLTRCFLSLSVALALASTASAATLYSQNFDVDDTANWTFNSSSAADLPADNANNEANYFFDYSTVGIPAAPGGSTTRGLKIESNVNDGAGLFMGASTSPTGLALPAQYILRAHVWQNANGATTPPGFPGGGTGSTQVTNMTVGVTGAANEFPGGTVTGVQGAATGEGGSGVDWRVYSGSMPDGAGAVVSPSLHPGVYAAGNTAADQNNTDAYYALPFPATTPPAAQTALFAQQNGATQIGTPAFAWHRWEMVKTLTEVTWSIDGTVIATLPASLAPANLATNPNFALGQMDINATTTDAAGRPLLFGLFDNVEVVEIPEPTSGLLVALAMLFAGAFRRR